MLPIKDNMLFRIWIIFTFWLIFIILIHQVVSHIDESSKTSEYHPHVRFRRKALQMQQSKSSSSQNEAELFRKLLKHPKVSGMCADFQQPMQGEEGPVLTNSKEFQLVQVHIFVSPGQTMPEKEIPALRLPSISCKFSRLISDHPKVRNFQETIYMFQNLQQGHNAFKVFPPNPNKRLCTQNDLTPFGSLQLIRNGEFLSKTYTKHIVSIRNNTLGSMINIQSIPEKLYYQSALAFSHGFLEREEFTGSTVEKSLPNFAPKSMNEEIDCPKLNRYSFMVEDAVNSGRLMFKRGHPSTKELAKVFESKLIMKSSALELVVTLLLYLCNKLSPSCYDARPGVKCLNVSSEGLNTAFNMADRYMRSVTSNPFFKDISILSTFPALQQVIEKASNIDNSEFFHVHSGKYSFLLYLLRTLDVRVDSVPSAASRLVLEFYNRTTDKSTFFRLLFNGKDVTANVLSCRTFSNQLSGLCPFDILKNYVNHDIFAKYNSETYEQACK